MVENKKESFFERFGKKEAGLDKKEISSPQKLVEEITAQENKNATENVGHLEEINVVNNSEKKDEQTEQEVSSGMELEVGKEKSDLLKKKEYWEKLINSIRSEKLSEDELENKEAQNKKILAEILGILIEKEKEVIQKGEAIQVVKLFKEIILPTIKKEDPEINEAYYWDEFHAKIVAVENIPDLS